MVQYDGFELLSVAWASIVRGGTLTLIHPGLTSFPTRSRSICGPGKTQLRPWAMNGTNDISVIYEETQSRRVSFKQVADYPVAHCTLILFKW